MGPENLAKQNLGLQIGDARASQTGDNSQEKAQEDMEKLDEVVQFIEPKEVGLGVPTD